MKENEINLIKEVLNFKNNVEKAQKYIKENYNVSSVFDETKSQLHISSSNIENSMMLIAAQRYLAENFGEDVLHVVM